MTCICGHEEDEHRDGSECEVAGCLCACYEPDEYEPQPDSRS